MSCDLDYRDRALTVISELGPTGFAVGSPRDAEDVLELVGTDGTDVVVLDATGCESAVGRVIASLAEALPRVGVVVVCTHCSAAARRLGALPKWGWTQDLRAGVERAYAEGNPLRPGLLASVRGSQRRRELAPTPRRWID